MAKIINKETIKNKVSLKINKIIDSLDNQGNINFFEINIKNVNGDLVYKVQNTYKDKI